MMAQKKKPQTGAQLMGLHSGLKIKMNQAKEGVELTLNGPSGASWRIMNPEEWKQFEPKAWETALAPHVDTMDFRAIDQAKNMALNAIKDERGNLERHVKEVDLGMTKEPECHPKFLAHLAQKGKFKSEPQNAWVLALERKEGPGKGKGKVQRIVFLLGKARKKTKLGEAPGNVLFWVSEDRLLRPRGAENAPELEGRTLMILYEIAAGALVGLSALKEGSEIAKVIKLGKDAGKKRRI